MIRNMEVGERERVCVCVCVCLSLSLCLSFTLSCLVFLSFPLAPSPSVSLSLSSSYSSPLYLLCDALLRLVDDRAIDNSDLRIHERDGRGDSDHLLQRVAEHTVAAAERTQCKRSRGRIREKCVCVGGGVVSN